MISRLPTIMFNTTGIDEIFYSFELKNKQNIPGCGINAVKGCTFFIDKIDPIKYEVTDGPDLQTGTILLIIISISKFRIIYL